MRIVILLLLASITSAFAADRACTITWSTSSDVFQDWDHDFHAFMQVQPSKTHPRRFIAAYQFAVSSLDGSRSLKLSLGKLEIGEGYFGSIGTMTPVQIEQMKSLGDGTYCAGFIIDKKRCSNVVVFSVDHTKTFHTPEIKVFGIYDLDRDFISGIGLWVNPGANLGKPILYSSIVYPDLVVDGILRHPKLVVWGGPDGPLKPYHADGSIALLSNYDPPIPNSGHHTVKAIVGSIASPVTEVSADRSTEKKFDSYFRTN